MKTVRHTSSPKTNSVEDKMSDRDIAAVRQNEIDEAWRIKDILDSMTPAQRLLFDKLERIEMALQNIAASAEKLANPRRQTKW